MKTATLTILLAAMCATARAAAPAPGKQAVTAALNRYLAQSGKLCVGKFAWPIDVSDHDREAGSRDALQLPVLEKLGLVAASNDDPAITRYTLTAAGKRFYLPRKIVTMDAAGKRHENTHDFCAGQLKLDKVVRWTPPAMAGEYRETTATYTYTIAPAAWTRDPQAQQVFPMVDRVIKGQRQMQLTQRLRLVNQRWEAVPLAE